MACFGATARWRATVGVVQKRPMSTPGVANRAVLEATARSHDTTSWHPAAVAIPCTAAIVLARMLAEGRLADTGARACLDLFTLDDYLDALRGFDIQATLLGPDPARRRVIR